MERLLLIANPLASGFTGALHRSVSAILRTGYDVTPVWPGSPAEARQLAAQAAGDGFAVAAAMGGDGVVHHVANGLVGTGTALGILPVGTTNVLARLVGTPRRTATAAKRLVAAPEAVPFPIAAITHEGPAGVRTDYGTFAVGLGYDAEVVDVAERRPHGKVWFGGFFYARNAVSVIWSRFRKRPANLRVEAEGRRADGVAVMVQLHRYYTYFGPKALGLTPNRGDGLTVMVLDHLDMKTLAVLGPRVIAGRRLDGAAGATVWTGVRRLIVEADPTTLIQSDGEILGKVETAQIVVAAEPLLVVR